MLSDSGQVEAQNATTAKDDYAFATVEVLSPWGERLILKIAPPKRSPPLIPDDPYYFIKQRCAWEDCNRLYSLSERGSRLYCSDKCQEAAKHYRAKLRRAGIPRVGDPMCPLTD